ncbi:hypothetical protein TNCV_1214691 [Trichonephila clavipes]|nr:hypothetical protein TNCV_1214691 [Trichonephila clavipes]
MARTSLYGSKRLRSSTTSTTNDNVQVVERIVMEGMANILLRYHTFRKQKSNHCPPFLLDTDQQLNCHINCNTRVTTTRATRCIDAQYPSFSSAY